MSKDVEECRIYLIIDSEANWMAYGGWGDEDELIEQLLNDGSYVGEGKSKFYEVTANVPIPLAVDDQIRGVVREMDRKVNDVD